MLLFIYQKQFTVTCICPKEMKYGSFEHKESNKNKNDSIWKQKHFKNELIGLNFWLDQMFTFWTTFLCYLNLNWNDFRHSHYWVLNRIINIRCQLSTVHNKRYQNLKIYSSKTSIQKCQSENEKFSIGFVFVRHNHFWLQRSATQFILWKLCTW